MLAPRNAATQRLAAAAIVIALVAAGCSDDRGAGTSPTTARPSETAAGSFDTSTSTSASASSVPNGGYTSAISDEVVDNPAFDDLELDITNRIRTVGLPGASLLVVQHGELVEQEAWLDYTVDTAVPIASASKWLTAAMIMTLVDEGVLDLDAPLATYAPEARGQVGTITTRQLLSFTSGLTADERVPCAEDSATTLQECARQFVARGVVHPPGDSFRYGAQHMQVAGAVAEIVTGQSFVDLVEERITGPLDMTATGFFQVGSRTGNEGVDHPSPAATGYSTLGDYGRFLEMIVHDGVAPDGTRILSSEAIVEMQRNQIEGAKYETASAFRVAAEAPYGLGEWLDWTDERGDALVLSSDGAFGFRPWVDKVNDLFGVYLVFDQGSGYVEGDPNAPADDAGKVHTSGLWVFSDTAEALGGSLPEEQYPHR